MQRRGFLQTLLSALGGWLFGHSPARPAVEPQFVWKVHHIPGLYESVDEEV
jgi:hypothetical protein